MRVSETVLRSLSFEEARDRLEVSGDLRQTYQSSFPPEEQLSIPSLISGLRTGQREIFVVEHRGPKAQLLGLCILCHIPTAAQIVLGEYLAVPEGQRRFGWGSMLFRYVSETVASEQKSVVFEVEPEIGQGALLAERRDRTRLYRSLNAVKIPCATGYRMPNMVGSGSLPMDLWWISGFGQPPPCGEDLRACIAGIYSYSYSSGTEDPLLQEVLAGLPCS